MESNLINNVVIINLTEKEAIVLYEVLHNQIENIEYSDYAEKKILLQLQGAVESKLSVMFRKDYKELLMEARKEVSGKDQIDDMHPKKK